MVFKSFRFSKRFKILILILIQLLLLFVYYFFYYHSYYDKEYISLTLPADDLKPEERTRKEIFTSNITNSRDYYLLKRLNVHFITESNNLKQIVQCPLLPANLVGLVNTNLHSYTIQEIEQYYSNVKHGGHWWPEHCTSNNRVAIIVPYRNRLFQLKIFLYSIHSFLQKQLLDYQIFLVEPQNNITFNRALLFNIGFKEALKHYAWECFIFHDVDLIPEDDRNFYSCPAEPRHMSVAVNTLDYQLPYRTIFGGVSAMTEEQFRSLNGFCNNFFGWGGEDDDMAARIMTKYRISRYPLSIGRYRMLGHEKDEPNQNRYRILKSSFKLRNVDGLSNLQYKVIQTDYNKLYSHIKVFYDEEAIKANVSHLLSNKRRKMTMS